MKRAYRLRSSEDFAQVFQRGRRATSPLFSITYRKNAGGSARFAFVVPKSTAKRAVVRNKLRRMISEWTRRNVALASLPYDVVVGYKKGTTEASRKDLILEYARMLENIFPSAIKDKNTP